MGKHVNQLRGATLNFTYAKWQSGVVMFIALVALVVMSLAALALIRSVGAGGTISGNMAFKQAATLTGDIGVELAFNALQTTIIPTSLEANIPHQYYGLMQPSDANGIPTPLVGTTPTALDWSTIPCYDTSPTHSSISCTDESSYRVQYIIDRQCTGTLPVTDIVTNCIIDAAASNGSHKSNGFVFSGANKVFYRVTINIRGPRKTSSLVQASLAF